VIYQYIIILLDQRHEEPVPPMDLMFLQIWPVNFSKTDEAFCI